MSRFWCGVTRPKTLWFSSTSASSWASSRSCSTNRTRASGRRSGGRSVSLWTPQSVCASSRTRQPSAAKASARSRALVCSLLTGEWRTISGAPSTQLQCPSVTTADHLRAEENATVSTCRHGEAGITAASVVAVVFASPARDNRPSALRTSGSREPEQSSNLSERTSPSVSVPVLSRQTTSTRARASTAGSSCTSVERRARVIAAIMNARLVSSTSPSGTMPTSAATVPVTASCQPWLSGLRNWLQIRTGATRAIVTEIHRSSRFVSATSSERVTLNRRASTVKRVA